MIEIIRNLLWTGDIASSIFILALVLTIGVLLSKIRIGGFSLGVSWVLFTGIFLGHVGLKLDPQVLSFVRETGMILFIFGIGMTVGPGFFATFRQGGVRLNLLSLLSILLSLVVSYVLYRVTQTPMATLMGILSGAVTNTPALAATQETARAVGNSAIGDVGIGYALGYPVAILGMILTMSVLKWVFRIDVEREERELEERERAAHRDAVVYALEVSNPWMDGKSVYESKSVLEKYDVVISRIMHHDSGEVEMAGPKSIIRLGDRLMAISDESDKETICAFLGKEVPLVESEWITRGATDVVSHRCLVTRDRINGKSIGSLKLRSLYNASITRVYRAGVYLMARPELLLQVGDTVIVVGHEEDVKHVEQVLGNSRKTLRQPNLLVVALTILIGVLIGSLRIHLPSMSMPVKLGFAGGTLVTAILLSNFGTHFRLNTHNTESANHMLRELGIALFLACVGLSVGESFVAKIASGGLVWMGYAALMMMIPLWITLIIGRLWLRLDYFTLLGYVAGSMTFAPALSLTPDATKNNIPSVRYATIYPLTLFLRVMAAQWMVLLLA